MVLWVTGCSNLALFLLPLLVLYPSSCLVRGKLTLCAVVFVAY